MKLMNNKKLKMSIKKDVEEFGAEWLNKQPVLLGNHAGVVQSDESGVYYARQYNGRVIKVINEAHVPPTFDLHVIAGESRGLPGKPQIIQVRETYLTPAASGEIDYHAAQHKLNGGDRNLVDRKQIMALNVLVYDAAGFIVRVHGANTFTAAGFIQVATQDVDLSSYVITAGAKFVAIEMDEDGIVAVVDGTVFGSREIATAADMPLPTTGSYLIAHVSIYDGQSQLADDDIVQPWPLAAAPGGGAGDVAGDTHAATNVTTPVDADEFPFWNSLTSLLAHVTWANIKATLDTLYSGGGHTHALDSDLTTIAALTPANDDILQRKAGAWANRTIAQLIADLGLGALAYLASLAHSSLTGIGANDHHAQDHAHNATDAQKLTQANSHQTPDTDTGTGSLHHTIGAGALQAAAGNHNHTGVYATKAIVLHATHWASSTIPASTTYYAMGFIDGNSGTVERAMPVLRAGTVKNLYIRITGNQPASGSLVVTIRKNASIDSVLTLTIAAGATAPATFQNITNSFTVAAGDFVGFKLQNNATAASAGIGFLAFEIECDP